MDVRFDNICFSSKGVKFIDFDRCAPATLGVGWHHKMYESEMYHAEEGWRAANLDWKQFGMLIADLRFPETKQKVN